MKFNNTLPAEKFIATAVSTPILRSMDVATGAVVILELAPSLVAYEFCQVGIDRVLPHS